MTDSTIWWLLGGAAVAIELLTGTFYLLMLAIGMAAGAIAAHLGAGLPMQLVAAGIVGGGATAAWHMVRKRLPSQASPDVNLDVGETVHVAAWGPDHTANVRYRGANWTVVPYGNTSEGPGNYRVREVAGSRLVVEKI